MLPERLFRGAEALRDDGAAGDPQSRLVVEDVVLGRHDLPEADGAFGLRHRRLEQQDAGAGGNGVGVFDARGTSRPPTGGWRL